MIKLYYKNYTVFHKELPRFDQFFFQNGFFSFTEKYGLVGYF
ncbi:hypothetical protein SD77_0599 [Bacillus badius]|uniref:Mobile element protein n=1 Tax=Bacillus badius TaxID=1455 RepID=A0ABR5B187_BACBA|nr:hypothetical protein SD77_0599 [Bacillus badius]